MRRALGVLLLSAGITLPGEASGVPSRLEVLAIRGVAQTLHLYGAGDAVAIVTRGDGGWTHLGPEVAEILAGEALQGCHDVAVTGLSPCLDRA